MRSSHSALCSALRRSGATPQQLSAKVGGGGWKTAKVYFKSSSEWQSRICIICNSDQRDILPRHNNTAAEFLC